MTLPPVCSDTPSFAALREALSSLHEESNPTWGAMNASQMLLHCSSFMDLYLGRIAVPGWARLLSRLIGPLFLRSFLTKPIGATPRNLGTMPAIKARPGRSWTSTRKSPGFEGAGRRRGLGRRRAARHVRGDEGGGRQGVGAPPHDASLSPVPAGLSRGRSVRVLGPKAKSPASPNPGTMYRARPRWGPRHPKKGGPFRKPGLGVAQPISAGEGADHMKSIRCAVLAQGVVRGLQGGSCGQHRVDQNNCRPATLGAPRYSTSMSNPDRGASGRPTQTPNPPCPTRPASPDEGAWRP